MKKMSNSISRFTQMNKKMCDSDLDIISHLPGNILDKILMCLPVQDVVRTSLLSRKWRYVWVKLPQLVFDKMFYRDSDRATHAKLLMIIYEVMLVHRGPIIKFALSLSRLESCSEIDKLILLVSNNDVQDFTLRMLKGDLYKLPSSLYSCLQLKHLNLSSCMLKPPPGFQGFTRLLSLCLHDVVIADDVLSVLISSCPLLEDLRIFSSTSLDSLDIVGPNLKYVKCEGYFRSIGFKNTHCLVHVSIYLNEACEGNISSSIVLLDSVPVIEFLKLDYFYVKGITAGGLPTRLPTTLSNLKSIMLSNICFEERDEVSFLICLFRSSPNLEEVTISAFLQAPSAIPIVLDFSEVHGCSDVALNQLRKVNMQLSGTKPELEFIKLLLAKSPKLDTVLIRLKSQNVTDELRIVKELTRLRRASPQAEMKFVH